MQQGTDNALRTRVYIDGYNLYYGCLKHSTDKWLDVRTLIERILPSILFEQDGEPVRFAFQAPAVKYFTAPILTAFAKSDDSISCQSHYHTALGAHLGGAIEISRVREELARRDHGPRRIGSSRGPRCRRIHLPAGLRPLRRWRR